MVFEFHLWVAMEAPRVVGFNEMDRITLCQRMGIAGLASGENELHLDEFPPIGAFLTGDGA